MANFGDILSSLTLAANQSVRRNAGDTAFEAFTAQTLDATLTALAAQNWAANAIPIGSGADTLSQVSFAANTFPARASTGNLVAKPITDFGLSLVDDANAAAAQSTLSLLGSNDRVLYQAGGVVAQSANLTHDGTNLGVGGPTIGTINGVSFSTIRGHFRSTAGGYLAMDAAGTSGLMLNDSSQSANNRNWAVQTSGTVFSVATYTDAGSGTQRFLIYRTGEVGVNTTSPVSKLTVGGTQNATLTTFTQSTANNAIGIVSPYTGPSYMPGLVWYTSDNNPTKPKAGIWTENTGSGSFMYFGTSNSYGTGITNQAVTIDPSGKVGLLTVAPTARFHIAAGSATANTAPLKLTTGTVNTTAEAGAVEYNNTFHVTNSDATRRHIATAPNTTKVTAGAPYTNDGYVVINIGGTDFKVMTTA